MEVGKATFGQGLGRGITVQRGLMLIVLIRVPGGEARFQIQIICPRPKPSLESGS
jgi:hypothetical protein